MTNCCWCGRPCVLGVKMPWYNVGTGTFIASVLQINSMSINNWLIDQSFQFYSPPERAVKHYYWAWYLVTLQCGLGLNPYPYWRLAHLQISISEEIDVIYSENHPNPRRYTCDTFIYFDCVRVCVWFLSCLCEN